MKAEMAAPFAEIVQNEQEYLTRIASQGKRMIGYFCTYTPLELIHAMGFLPVRITGSSRRAEKAYSLMPSFICPYMRGVLEKGLCGDYGFLSGIVQGYTCDAACGMVNIWEENIGGSLFYSLPLPYNDSPGSREFMRARLRDLAGKLESLGGRYSEEALNASVALYENIRTALLDLYDMRYRGALPLSAAAFLQVILAGFIASPEDYLRMIRELMSSLDRESDQQRGGVPLLVSGSIIENPRFFEIIEDRGGRVIADDLCTGYRGLQPPAGSGVDAMDALIDRFMKRFPCPSRIRAVERLPLLLDLLQASGARGVLFLLQKFCTPHLADHPMLYREMNARGIPSLEVEIEESLDVDGQFLTRIESFLEILR
ncbi:MAG: 2-hydroxyacyl-CoA dehydratase [Spirochaetes bacterium]|nr:2-hydroxyacyl-CoA dehydratase [Spirochaetota bacterium]